jgi:DNA-binding transcriptional ArsR family regulator
VAGEIAAAFDVTRRAVCQHLALLKDAGLVSERRDGSRRLYRAEPDGFADFRRYLDQLWGTALERGRALAEADNPLQGKKEVS